MPPVTVICNSTTYDINHLDHSALQQQAYVRVVTMQSGPDMIVSCGSQSMALLDLSVTQQNSDVFLERFALLGCSLAAESSAALCLACLTLVQEASAYKLQSVCFSLSQ